MEFNTPAALREIKAHSQEMMLVNGKESCPLQAMAFTMNYHKVDIVETKHGLHIKGTSPVKRNNKFLTDKVRRNIANSIY
jgi:5-enolpyruvylshikimate-3-phosphate synthase